MQYAHDRKVLHRDLKPGNIMLGKYGETLVVDWGLAKATGKDVPRESTTELESPIVPASGSQSAPTMAGSTIGTPAYMPPEQAEGRIEELGPASDVYSLGATLYEILAGERPLRREKLPELLKRVREGDVPSTRSINPHIPAALDAVCQKAMALRPADRYESAKHLADDLEAWLADEPVSVYAEPLAVRARRWIRRHPALVSATVAGILMALVGLSVLSAVVTSKNEALTESEARATAGEALANQNALEAQEQRDAAKAARTEMELQRDAARDAQATAEASEVRAVNGEQLAEQRRKETEAQRDRTKRQLYASEMFRVAGDVESGRFASGIELLETIPFEQRGWEARYLHGQMVRTPLRLSGHTGLVACAAFSPDGSLIVSSSSDSLRNTNDTVIKVWDAITGEERLSLHGHTREVHSVAFSADGKRIVSGSEDETLKVWDAATGVELLTLSGHTDDVTEARFSSNGAWVISGSDDNTVKVWDAGTGEKRVSLGHSGDISSVCFSPDDTRILTCGAYDETVRLWDAVDGNELLALTGHTGPVRAARFSPDGTRIASCSDDRTVRIWDAATGAELFILRGHKTRVVNVVYSPDGARLFSRGGDQSGNFRIRQWDAISGADLGPFGKRDYRVLSFSSDGARLATVESNDLLIENLPGNRDALTLAGHTERVDSVRFSPTGGRVVSGDRDGIVRVWDAWTGEELLAIRAHNSVSSDGFTVRSDVQSVEFSPDGTQILSCGSDECVKLWESSTGELQQILHDDLDGLQYATFSADGKHILCSGDSLTVFDSETGGVSVDSSAPRASYGAASFSPDGRQIAVVHGSAIKIWDVATGSFTKTLWGHVDLVFSVCFTHDGTRIVSGGSDRTVRIWDAETGDELHKLQGHTIRSFVFQ